MDKAGPRAIRFDELDFVPRFAYGDQARVVETSGTGEGTVLGTGFARFSGARIPWTIKYDEVILVIEGALTVKTGDGELRAGPKDCVWLPAGTELTYVSDDALVFYAIHPSNWAERDA